MLKTISNLGTTLNKSEQKQVKGGIHIPVCVSAYAACDAVIPKKDVNGFADCLKSMGC